MLDINHIASVLSTEATTYSAGAFVSTIFYVWIAYYITGSIEKKGFIFFWFIYSLLHIYYILHSNFILYDPFFYFATTVLLLQLNFHKLVKRILAAFTERAKNKYNQCKARNMYYDSVEAKVKREEEAARKAEIKNRQQKDFLESLDRKLDGKFKL